MARKLYFWFLILFGTSVFASARIPVTVESHEASEPIGSPINDDDGKTAKPDSVSVGVDPINPGGDGSFQFAIGLGPYSFGFGFGWGVLTPVYPQPYVVVSPYMPPQPTPGAPYIPPAQYIPPTPYVPPTPYATPIPYQPPTGSSPYPPSVPAPVSVPAETRGSASEPKN